MRRIDAAARWFREPWRLSVLLVALIPALPDYVCPLLAMGALAAALVDARRRGGRMTSGPLGWLVAAYTVYMAVGLIYTPHVGSTLSTVGMWAVMLTAYLATTTALVSRERLRAALLCNSVTAGVTGLIGCGQYLLGLLSNGRTPIHFWGFLDNIVLKWFPIELLPLTTELRVSSTFNNPNIFGEYLIMVIPFVAYFAFSGKKSGIKVVCRVSLLLAAGAVLFTFSRACYFALVAAALVFCLGSGKRFVLLAPAGAAGLLLMPDAVVQRLLSLRLSDVSVNERARVLQAGIQAVARHPLAGVGAGVSNSWDILRQEGINAPHMHNLYLQILVEGGVPALLLMLVVLAALLRIGVCLVKNGAESRSLGIAFLAFFVAFLFLGLVEFPFLTPKLVGVFLLVLGLGDSASGIFLGRPPRGLRETPGLRRLFLRQENGAGR